MFEVAVSRQTQSLRSTLVLYIPFLESIWVRATTKCCMDWGVLSRCVQPDKTHAFVAQCQEVIKRVAGTLIQEKKRKMAQAAEKGEAYDGKDLLSLMRQSQFFRLASTHVLAQSDMYAPHLYAQ